MKSLNAARDVCPLCLDTGLVHVDATDRRGEHVTRETACPDCSGSVEYDDDRDPAEREGRADDNAEARWEVGL